jgi:hypothetical protein
LADAKYHRRLKSFSLGLVAAAGISAAACVANDLSRLTSETLEGVAPRPGRAPDGPESNGAVRLRRRPG